MQMCSVQLKFVFTREKNLWSKFWALFVVIGLDERSDRRKTALWLTARCWMCTTCLSVWWKKNNFPQYWTSLWTIVHRGQVMFYKVKGTCCGAGEGDNKQWGWWSVCGGCGGSNTDWWGWQWGLMESTLRGINHTTVPTEIDSGAQVSVLPVKYLNKLISKSNVRPKKINSRAANNQPIAISTMALEVAAPHIQHLMLLLQRNKSTNSSQETC